MKSVLLLVLLAISSISAHVAVNRGVVPVFTLDRKHKVLTNKTSKNLKFLPFIMLADQNKDTNDYWRETEILSLVRDHEADVDYERCASSPVGGSVVRPPSARVVRPICRNSIDFQLCPQCAHFSNTSECELFRESCKERRVHPSEYHTYCENKYGKWRTVFIPADYSQCRCCDECVFYREMDQSCVHDDFDITTEEFLPVNTIDFRAGCNPYWGHPDQETLALRCDKNLRRCVPMTAPSLPKNTISIRRNPRYDPIDSDCPVTCRGYTCPNTMQHEQDCSSGAFVPDSAQCNCCGRCSAYFQLNHKCAEFKKTVKNLENGSSEIEIEEEFLEPGCDDGLVCRQGSCQDIHTVQSSEQTRKRDVLGVPEPYEPCKQEMKIFKKKYGSFGHMHYEAPQCTPLWLYAPVQCRRFLCYCALEDGTPIEGVKVPRVEVSNMNCDCAREKCRLNTNVECDGFGNYREAMFAPHVDELSELEHQTQVDAKTPYASEQKV